MTTTTFFSATAILAIVAADSDRKVPPRTPPQRLNTLHRFADDWISAQIAGEINRPSRAARMSDTGIDRLHTKMLEAYTKECSFFDPTVPHGGPNPNSTRKRRATFAKAELSRIAREVADNDALDIFDQMEANFERGMGDILRLSDDIDLAWKQIGTGFRKWILRYISDCNGQKNYTYHTRRLSKVII